MSSKLHQKSFARHRTKGQLTEFPEHVKWYRINGSCGETAWTLTGDFGATAHGELITMDDVVTPRFRELQAKGDVAFNPMNYKRVRMTYTNPGFGQENERQTPAGCIGTGAKQRGKTDGPTVLLYINPLNYPVFPNLPSFASLVSESDLADAKDEVTTKVLADRGKGDSNLFESIAEYKQTLKLFSNGINRYWGWFSRNESYLKDTNPAKAWLTYRYGIMPLVRDVEMILKGLKQKVGKRRKTSRAKLSFNRAKTTLVDTGSIYGSYKVHSEINTVENIEIRAMSLDEYTATVYSNIGLSTKGFLTTPWELVPYSFVVDWFANVGDFINALAPAPGWDQLGSALSVRVGRVTVVRTSGLTVLDPNYVNKRMPQGEFELVEETKTRGLLGLPKLVIKADFKLDNTVRLTDALALAAVRLQAIFGKRG